MYQKILVAMDGSEHSKNALTKAVMLVKNLKSACTLTILHVNPTIPVVDPAVAEEIDIERLLSEEGQQIMKLAGALLAGAEVEFETIAVFGDPAKKICEAALEHDLIVMGSRGLGAISEIVLGSVSHKVIKQASCPVLIVK